MIIFTFFILNINNEERFFKENFLLANVKSDIVFEITFLIISNADINSEAQNL